MAIRIISCGTVAVYPRGVIRQVELVTVDGRTCIIPVKADEANKFEAIRNPAQDVQEKEETNERV